MDEVIMDRRRSLNSERLRELKRMSKEIRISIINTTHHARAGHTGGSLSEVEILTALYFEVMKINPKDAQWANRDRFILSKGHASPGYYCTLAKRGYFSEDLLKNFDHIDSLLQGHPDMRKTPGVDMSTGSLGQGISVGIGMALGGKSNCQCFYTYVLVGCGELQEGQIWEAAMYAGFHQVSRLITIVDYNKVQLSEQMDNILSTQPLADKWRSFGWRVLECDGHDIGEVVSVLYKAKEVENEPVIVIAHTIKGKGVSFMENNYKWHGRAPDREEREKALKEIETC